MSFRGKCTANNARSQNGNAWGDVFAFEKKKGIQVGFFFMADKWFYLFRAEKNASIWLEAEMLQTGVKNETRTPCVLLSWLRVCSCSNELHNEFRQSQQKSINLRSGAPLNPLRAWNIGEKTWTLPKPPGAITEPGRPQIDRLIWSAALVHKGLTRNI